MSLLSLPFPPSFPPSLPGSISPFLPSLSPLSIPLSPSRPSPLYYNYHYNYHHPITQDLINNCKCMGKRLKINLHYIIIFVTREREGGGIDEGTGCVIRNTSFLPSLPSPHYSNFLPNFLPSLSPPPYQINSSHYILSIRYEKIKNKKRYIYS